MSRPKLLDLFGGEGGAAAGYERAGFDVYGIDNDPARLERYPYPCEQADALEFVAAHGHKFDVIHGSPTCTGYSRGTAAVPDRLERYHRLIPATRDLLTATGRPYVIENVEDAADELRAPLLLCGTEFDLHATDTDGTRVRLERHRLFESNVFLWGAGGCAGMHTGPRDRQQTAGAYGGARRDKTEAKVIRRGGYVPRSVDVLRALLGTPWMTERGCFLSIPPVYTEHIGSQLLAHVKENAA